MKKNQSKKVYIGLTVDILHHGHINLINNACSFGKLTVGLLTDKAVSEKKKIPVLNYYQRKKIIENVKGVTKVVPQNEWDYSKNIKKYKPDFFVHGDDWKKGPERNVRSKVISILKKTKCKLVEIPHTKGISSTALNQQKIQNELTPSLRLSSLKNLIKIKKFCRIIETHSPISALIAENVKYQKNNSIKFFDGFWSSSLTDSTVLGKPDNEYLDLSERLSNINRIFDVTSKPLIMDVDTGGKIEHLELQINTIERLGISAIIMEDKKGLKKNSLLGTKVKQYLETKKNFCEKIKTIKKNQKNPDFMIIARLESLILKKGMSDAISRADAYIRSGADGIMIHSKEKTPKEVFDFAKIFKKKHKNIPLICVPSSYSSVRESELEKKGFNIVIYANQVLRASYKAMEEANISILKNGRAKELEKKIISIEKTLKLIPGTS